MATRETTAQSLESAVTDEVLANLFQAIADDMASLTLRSAYTTFVKETQDFGTGLVTTSGELVAYPGGAGAKTVMGVPLGPGVDPRHDWKPGDVLITNDPFHTDGMVTHLNDVYVFVPAFAGEELLGFCWGFIHCTDVGGAVPGSITFVNSEIYQEGLRIRPVKLYREGVLNTDIKNIFLDNCRIPADNWGDMTALIAALNSGRNRMIALADKYGAPAVRTAMEHTIDATEALARSALSKIPAGEYRFVEYFEDDYVTDVPVRIEVALRIKGDGQVTLDFTGTDPRVRSALNLATGSQPHHPFLARAIINFVGTFAPGVRLNVGILRCVELIAPEGSIVNAQAPCACGLRIGTVLKAHDAVLGCLGQALPEAVPAAGAGQVVITYVSTSEKGKSGRVVVVNPVQGGSGGASGMDGINGADRPVAFLKNVPIEVLESEAPVLIRRYGLMPDSEGAGEFRGGFGIQLDIETTTPSATLVMRGQDRHVFTPWGTRGGQPGSNANCLSTGRDGEQTYLGKANNHRPTPGELVSIVGAGGGGYGDPLLRDPERVLTDYRNGLVSFDRVRTAYGVVLTGDGPTDTVDDAATTALRAELTADRPPLPELSLGTARDAYQLRFGGVIDGISEWLWDLPEGIRADAKVALHRELRSRGDGPYGTGDLEAAIAATGMR
jgi:N-methylhydantoinase B